MKYTGDLKENLIVILFSVITIFWLYKSDHRCNKKFKNTNPPKWVIIFDKIKIFLFFISLSLYGLNCLSFNYNMVNFKKKYKMKIYTEPPNFN
jgi:hypothetical protein